MTAIKKFRISNKSVVLRHVYVQGKFYVCGICRHQYDEADDANDCLVACWNAQQTSDELVVSRRVFLHTTFRCKICNRSYNDPTSAKSCALQCRTQLTITTFGEINNTPGRVRKNFTQRYPESKPAFVMPFQTRKNAPNPEPETPKEPTEPVLAKPENAEAAPPVKEKK